MPSRNPGAIARSPALYPQGDGVVDVGVVYGVVDVGVVYGVVDVGVVYGVVDVDVGVEVVVVVVGSLLVAPRERLGPAVTMCQIEPNVLSSSPVAMPLFFDWMSGVK